MYIYSYHEDFMTSFDFIIAGAGASGLMLCRALASDPFFAEKRILLLDKSEKQSNDRTWCFWETGNGEFDGLIKKSWPKISFKGRDFTREMDTTPYRYKMLEAKPFYNEYLETLRSCNNVSLRFEHIENINSTDEGVIVTTDVSQYYAPDAFTSILNPSEMYAQEEHPVLIQHFRGWFVKTSQPVFDPERAIFMDFSIPQDGNTRFMYVLPESSNSALVEYTLFSKDYLEDDEYDEALQKYMLEQLKCEDYEILRVENGSIPMTVYDFTKNNTSNLLYIGTAGGWTKASTGYTFKNSQKKVRELVEYLKTGKPLDQIPSKKRHRFYDLLLLDILDEKNHLGQEIFESLFKKRTAPEIFRFLDEETSFWEDLKIISACPKGPFLRALLKRLF